MYAFQEENGHKLSGGDINTMWVRNCYGGEVVTDIGDNLVSCSGYVVGTASQMKSYMGVMAKQLLSHASCESNGIDQGIHNVMVYSQVGKDINFVVEPNRKEVLTMGYIEAATLQQQFHVDNNSATATAAVTCVENCNNKLSTVVHQCVGFTASPLSMRREP